MADVDRAAAFRARLEHWIAPLSHEDKVLVLDWVEKALAADPDDEDDVAAGLVSACLDGDVEIAGVRNDEVTFRLTKAGSDHVLDMLTTNPKAREFLSRVNVAHGKPPISDPSKESQ